MVRTVTTVLAVVVGMLLAAGEALANKRVALVIGNSAYEHTPVLKNPANDAADMARALRALGFEVIQGLDLKQSDMRETIRRFGIALEGADVGLFFYAGHGLQVAGQNYLAPVDARLRREGDLDFDMVRLELILRQMEREAKTNLVFLDACRDNPLARSLAQSMGTRSAAIGRGLARVESGVGTYIAFATQPGNVALDGEGRNSPFTSALARHIQAEGKSLADVMIAVRNDVIAATAGKQVPWEHHALTGQFYFGSGPAATVTEIRRDGGGDDLAALKERLARLELELKAKLEGLGEARDERPAATQASRASEQGWLGVRIAAVEDDVATRLGIEKGKGAVISQVLDESPAARAGIEVGDVVLDMGGAPVADAQDLSAKIASHAADTVVDVQVARASGRRHLEIRLGSMPAELKQAREADAFAQQADEAFRAQRFEESARLARQAVELGSANGMFRLASLYFEGQGMAKDEAQAARLYRQAAEKGHVGAMTNTGWVFAAGRGVPKDDNEAFRWFRKAAEQGATFSMHRLGWMYANGEGTAKDEREAVNWFRKGAEAGHADSLYSLGGMYDHGRGVAKDDRQALHWYRQAADKGHVGAMRDLGVFYEYGRGVAKDEREAVRWYREAANKDNAAAAQNLGRMYAEGRGVAKDEREAVKWYRQSAEKGNVYGMNSLGWMYDNGRGVAKDQREAARWFRQAADKGYAVAQFNIGLMYHNGTGVPQDHREAANWYFKAVDGGEAGAYYNLALLHSGGLGVGKDQQAAARYMVRALKGGYEFARQQMTTNAGAWDVAFRRALQEELRREGAYSGAIDGRFGPGTTRAVEAVFKR